MTAAWNPRGILTGQPWAVQFRLPTGVASALLGIARPDGAAVVQLAQVNGTVTGLAGQTVTFAMTGQDTAALGFTGRALADVWVWPADGGPRYRLFDTAVLPVEEPAARLVGFHRHPGPPPTGWLPYPATFQFPGIDVFPAVG